MFEPLRFNDSHVVKFRSRLRSFERMRGFKKFLSKLKTRRKGRKVKQGAPLSTPAPNTISTAITSANISTYTPNTVSAVSSGTTFSTHTRNAVYPASARGDVNTIHDDISETTSEGDGASINSTEVNVFTKETRGQTALHRAARHNKGTTISRLLSRGADISAVDNKGRTALHIAAARGHVGCAQILVDSGAPLKSRTRAKSREGGAYMTPIMMARSNGHRDVVNIIRNHVGLPEVQAGMPLVPKYGFSGGSYDSRSVEYKYRDPSPGLWPDYALNDIRTGERQIYTASEPRYWY